MTRVVFPGARRGTVTAPASKSQVHRLLLAAALGEGETLLRCEGFGEDIFATVRCLNELGASITQAEADLLRIKPIKRRAKRYCVLPCGDSGTTLRLLLPVVGLLDRKALFLRQGRLPERPISALTQELEAHGMRFASRGAEFYAEGKLRPGEYSLPGDVSSQFVSALLMSLPLLPGESTLQVFPPVESAGYIAMTEDVLHQAGILLQKTEGRYSVPGKQRYRLPKSLTVEGDWSGAAFFLCLGALSPDGVEVGGLSWESQQGDRTVLDLLRGFGAQVVETEAGIKVSRGELRGQQIDAASIPDLVPALSIVAAAAQGDTTFVHAARLRFKESDRLQSMAQLLHDLGGTATEHGDSLIVRGCGSLRGGDAESFGDHRIAMAAAVAAAVCENPVSIRDAHCVKKSYPGFWEAWDRLEVCLP